MVKKKIDPYFLKVTGRKFAFFILGIGKKEQNDVIIYIS